MSHGSNKKNDTGFSEKGGRGGYQSQSSRPLPPPHFKKQNKHNPPPQAAGYTEPQTYPSYPTNPATPQYSAGPQQYPTVTPQYTAPPQYAVPPQYAASPQYAVPSQYPAPPQYHAPVHYSAPQPAPQIISVSIQTPHPAAPPPSQHYQPPPPQPPPPLLYQPSPLPPHYQPPAPQHFQPHPQAQPAPSQFYDPHTRKQQTPHSSQKSYPPAPQRKPFSGQNEYDRGERYNNKTQYQTRPQSRDRSSPNPRAFETGSRSSSASRQNVNYRKDQNEGKPQRYNQYDNKNPKSKQENDPPPSFNRSRPSQSESFSSSRGGRNFPPNERRPNPDMQNTNFQERIANVTGRRSSNTSQSSESGSSRRLFSEDPPPSYDSLYSREASSPSFNSQRANTPGYSNQRGQPSRGRAKNIERCVRDDGQTESIQQTNKANSKHESASKTRQAAGRGRPQATAPQPAGADEASVENTVFDSSRSSIGRGRGRGNGRGRGRGRGRGQFKPRGHSYRIGGSEREDSQDSSDVNTLLNLESQLKNTVNIDDKSYTKLSKAADTENTGQIKKKKRKKKLAKPLQPASEDLLKDSSVTQCQTKAKLQIMSSFRDDASLREAVEFCVDKSATAVVKIVTSSVSCSEGESECTVMVSSENYQVGKRIVMSLCKRLKEHLKSRVMYDISCLEMDKMSTSGDEHAVQGKPISNPISKDMKVSDADNMEGTKQSLNPDQEDPNQMQSKIPEDADISEGSTEEDDQSTDDEEAEIPSGEDPCELREDYEDENEAYEEEEIIEGEEGEDFDGDEQEEEDEGGNDLYEELEEEYPENCEGDDKMTVPEDSGQLTEVDLDLHKDFKKNSGQDNNCEKREDLEICVLSDLKSMLTSTKISLVINQVFSSEDDLKSFLSSILENAKQTLRFALLPDTFMAATKTTLCDLLVTSKEDAKNFVRIISAAKLKDVVIRCLILDD